MMDDRSFETLLHDALSRSGEPAPFSVDVADRVMGRVAVLGAPRRMEHRHFAQWAAAAGVAGLALLAVALWKGPGFDAMVASLGLTTAGLVNAGAKLVAPANAVANGLGRAMTALAGSAQTLLHPLAPFQPLARVLLVALTAGMLGITTFIVGRDVRRRAADEEHA
jgi:hypothetical protein